MLRAALPWLLGGTCCASLGQVFFKLGADGRSAWADFANPWTGAGLVFYAVGTVLWIRALSQASLTAVYPFTALTFVLVYAAGVLCLGEPTSPIAIIGVVLVLAGLYCITAA